MSDWNMNCRACSGRDLTAQCTCIVKCTARHCEGARPRSDLDTMTDGG